MSGPKAKEIVERLLEQSDDVDEAISRHLEESGRQIREMMNKKILGSHQEITDSLRGLRYRVCFILFDYDTKILFANETACSMFGLPHDKVIGESIMRFYAPEHYNTVEEFSEEVDFLFERGYWFGNAHIVSDTGERTDYAAVTFLMDAVDGRPCVAGLALPLESFKTFVDSDHTADKERYLEMSAKIRGWEGSKT